MRDKNDWKLEELKEELLQRMTPDWDLTRVELELHKIDVKVTDDPLSIMSIIEDVLIRRSEDITAEKARAIQHNHFIRLIPGHQPMHTYITQNSKKHCDPKEAVTLAQRYLREQGNTVNYFKTLVKDSLTEAGIDAPKTLEPTSVFPLKSPVIPGSSTTAIDASSNIPTIATSKSQVVDPTTQKLKEELKLMSAKMNEVLQKCEQVSVMQSKPMQPQPDLTDMMQQYAEWQQFIKRGTQLDMDEIVRRFNQDERLMRDLRVAGLPDFMKKKVNEQMYGSNNNNRQNNNSDGNRFSTKDKPSYKNDDRSRSSDSRNSSKPNQRRNGRDKQYRRKFVPKDNGKFVAQFETDESDDDSGSNE
jgi:hypothetical protein